MACTALPAGVALLRGLPFERPTALLSNGMAIYSAINSSVGLLCNQPCVLALTGATVVASLASAWVLIRSLREVSKRRRRTAPRPAAPLSSIRIGPTQSGLPRRLGRLGQDRRQSARAGGCHRA